MAVMMHDLTQEKVDELFDIFRTVNRSHWKTPLLGMVKYQLQDKGRYEFKVGIQDNWTQKFVIEEQDKKIRVRMEINEHQPQSIVDGLKTIKSFFDGEIVKHY